jgi:hypothetical protein
LASWFKVSHCFPHVVGIGEGHSVSAFDIEALGAIPLQSILCFRAWATSSRRYTRHVVLSTGELTFFASMGWPHYRDRLRDCCTDCADQASCSRAEFEQPDIKDLRLALLSLSMPVHSVHGMKGVSLEQFERLHRVPSSCAALDK